MSLFDRLFKQEINKRKACKSIIVDLIFWEGAKLSERIRVVNMNLDEFSDSEIDSIYAKLVCLQSSFYKVKVSRLPRIKLAE